jgi:hypothetical protein
VVYSTDGHATVRQYFCRKPLYYQPGHSITNTPV